MKRILLGLALSLSCTDSWAEKTYDFSFKNKDILEAIDSYAKMSKKTFVIDPSVRGKVTVLNPEPVTVTQAFNQLSSALQQNGFVIYQTGEKLNISAARFAQRSSISVVTELPPIEPEQMITYIYKPKFLKAEELNKNLRILPSKDGEMVVGPNNTIVFSDWISTLHRIQAVLAELDKDPKAKR